MIIQFKEIIRFQNIILEWYSENSRNFLWRDVNDSYIIIISEILLQRTKAETVSNFLPQFLSKYPFWEQLGESSQDEIKNSLRSIGLYNQKGTRLYNLAQEIKKRKGQLPTSYEEVLKLPMIGQYIANAYALFILGKAYPLLDVNMARLLERYFGPRTLADIRYDPYLQNLAKRVVDHPYANEINWGILDFASLVCKNRNPKCIECPLKLKCKYFSIASC